MLCPKCFDESVYQVSLYTAQFEMIFERYVDTIQNCLIYFMLPCKCELSVIKRCESCIKKMSNYIHVVTFSTNLQLFFRNFK